MHIKDLQELDVLMANSHNPKVNWIKEIFTELTHEIQEKISRLSEKTGADVVLKISSRAEAGLDAFGWLDAYLVHKGEEYKFYDHKDLVNIVAQIYGDSKLSAREIKEWHKLDIETLNFTRQVRAGSAMDCITITPHFIKFDISLPKEGHKKDLIISHEEGTPPYSEASHQAASPKMKRI